MNFREFLQLSEQSPMKTGQAPNKPANLSTTAIKPTSDMGGGGPTKNTPTLPTSRPPGSGNGDYPVKVRPPGQIPVTMGVPKVLLGGPFGSGTAGPGTPKVPPSPVPSEMTKKMARKMKKK